MLETFFMHRTGGMLSLERARIEKGTTIVEKVNLYIENKKMHRDADIIRHLYVEYDWLFNYNIELRFRKWHQVNATNINVNHWPTNVRQISS